MTHTTWIRIALSVSTVLAATLLFFPATHYAPPSEPSFVPKTGLPGQAALRAFIDPETGKVEVSTADPTLTLDPETAEAVRRDTEGLRPVYHPNGAVSVHLQGRFQSASVARIDNDGRVVLCTEDALQVQKALGKKMITDSTGAPTLEVR